MTPIRRMSAGIAGIGAVVALGAVASPVFASTVSTPNQISNFAYENGDNGLNQAVAIAPDGTGMGISYEIYDDGGTQREAFITQAIDATGAPVGTATRIFDEGAGQGVTSYNQPAIAYNPATGGWFACVFDHSAFEIVCAYLNADGAVNGNWFTISNGSGTVDQYASASIAWSPVKQKFLVIYSSYYTAGDRGLRWVGGTGGAEGASPLSISLPVGPGPEVNGGVGPLAYAPETDTFVSTIRGRGDAIDFWAPWIYRFDGDGVQQGDPVAFAANGSNWQNGSVAYSAATDQFVATSIDTVTGNLDVRRSPANDPLNLDAPTTMTFDASTFRTQRFRATIAASPLRDEIMITTALNRQTAAGGGRGIYVLSGPAASPGAPELVDVSNTTDNAGPNVPGNRPRVTFSSEGCGYMVSYNKQTTEAISTQWMTTRVVTGSGGTCPEPQLYALTVSKSGDGSGTVTSNVGGIDCGATCQAQISSGTSVTLTATPSAGSTFAGWSGACSGTATCTVSVAGATAVTANFAKSATPAPSPTPTPTPAPVNDPIVLPIAAAQNVLLPNNRTRTTMRLRYQDTGRYSFFLQDKKGKRIPMLRNSTVGTRVLKKTFWAPVVQDGKAGSGVRITALTQGRLPTDSVLRVVLRNPDGSLVAQSIAVKP